MSMCHVMRQTHLKAGLHAKLVLVDAELVPGATPRVLQPTLQRRIVRRRLPPLQLPAHHAVRCHAPVSVPFDPAEQAQTGTDMRVAHTPCSHATRSTKSGGQSRPVYSCVDALL